VPVGLEYARRIDRFTWTIHKGGQGQYWDGDGRYGVNLTITAHTTRSDGVKQLFDRGYRTVLLQEICPPFRPETDFYEFGPALTSPETTVPDGGYATDFYDCWFGQAITWEWTFEWENQVPPVPYDDEREFRCRVKRQFSGSGGETYGWCAD